jgi:hypothetical protein
MAPIPNPEDLPPAERRRIYGAVYDGDGGVGPAERSGAAPPRSVVAPRPHPIKPAPARPAAVAGPPAAEKPAAPVATTPTAPAVAPRGIFNWGTVDVPGVGRMRWETVVGSGLLLLALVLLVAIARNASEAEARAHRRRQKAGGNAEADATPPGETKAP